jgi:hypothetical protein
MPSISFEPRHNSSKATSGLRFFSTHLYTATVQQRRNSTATHVTAEQGCDYSHFFTVRLTHKIAVKCFSHAQKLKDKRRAF